MKKSIMNSTNFTNTVTDSIVSSDAFSPHTHYVNCKIDITASFEGCEDIHFENCIFTDLTFKRCEFLDVIFSGCDLSNSDFEDSVFFRVLFKSCKLMGANFISTYSKDTQWIDSQLPYANFSEAKLVKSAFEANDMTESFFQDATFESIRFIKDRLTGCDFSQTKLKGVDLSTCEFYHIVVSPELLKGLKIAHSQASAIVHHFGVELTD
ncbi:pentapeptide repeat-containing protein [Brochothrix thermosphacta]|nr:pentapeptide repeat-containing protein [Brochothrix thermosphacta]ODJ66507.1 hypothetical protein BFR36_06775 [Brochothrix thermosphacta]ODJ72879.1 hypothetical protein BFR45_09265 [Brochothrix thermosphacta]ODJ73779.1 hypothetical protein BFR39_10825 [Brochothrix thermosphacta]SPP29015.1 conserved hypothetical protein [Brochothrix thermosphacta]